MPSLKIPAKENSKEVLARLVHEIGACEQQVGAKTETFDEVSVLGQENAELEARINDAKETMFMLLYERVKLAEADFVEEYISLIKAEVDELKEAEEKKGKK